MAINSTNLISGTNLTQKILNSAADSAIRGYKDAAIKKLKESGLSEAQMLKITTIINTVQTDGSTTALGNLKNQILASLCIFPGADIPILPAPLYFDKSSTSEDAISEEDRCFYYFPNLPEDMIGEIFGNACVGDPKSAGALALTCKYCYQIIIGYSPEDKENSFLRHFLNLEKACPKLSILTPKDLRFLKHAMPSYNKLQVFHAYHTLLFQKIAHNRGVTLMAIPKGLNIDKLLTRAKKQGLEIELPEYAGADARLKSIPSYFQPVEQTYLVLIANDIYEESVPGLTDLGYNDNCEFAKKAGCDLPMLEELLALHIFTPELCWQPGQPDFFWKCSKTFDSINGVKSWGIEFFCDFMNQMNTIGIAPRDEGRSLFSAVQGVIRFLPSKK